MFVRTRSVNCYVLNDYIYEIVVRLRMRCTCCSRDGDREGVRVITTSCIGENDADKLWTEAVGQKGGGIHAAYELEQWCVLNRISTESYL